MYHNLRRKLWINIINHPVAEKYLQHENHLKNEIQIYIVILVKAKSKLMENEKRLENLLSHTFHRSKITESILKRK